VKKCDYCAFYSLPNQSDEIKRDYFEALCRQIGFFPTDRKVETVYFGGGTPPMLGVERLCKLIELISTRFELKDDCEITVEINPETVDYDALCRLKNAGANRLSIGIQSSNDEVLKRLGRIHTFQRAKDCILDAKKAGFENISADIIFGLPNTTEEVFKKTLCDIMSTKPNHISAYSLQVEEGTPLFEKKSSLDFPDEESEERQYELLCKILTENGFEHYEISSFAKEGFRSRHNSNYWKRREYFGFGAAAHSFFNGKRFSAVCDVLDFIEKSKASLFAPTDYDLQEILSEEDAFEEAIMLGLRTSDGALVPEGSKSVAERIAKLGFGRFENGRLCLNSRGFRVSNEIIAEIII
jgi:oxygen-independent coproporphyrinogen-3 oxidase